MRQKFLITGASSGIGAAIANRLLQAGHRVVGLARRGGVRKEDANFTIAKCDLADLNSLGGRLKEIALLHTVLDGVILCAGTGDFGSLEEFSDARIWRLIDLNLTSAIHVAQTFLPPMKRRGGGNLVIIGSEAALRGGRRGAVYAATKFGLRGLAQSLREECAGSGVPVSLVNPGMVDTPFFDNLDFAPGEDPENYIRPDDVAEVVMMILNMSPGTVIDEVNLSPLKKVIRSKR
ncbi:MAG: SDR family oxidoreductase [Pseudomonadota bacterium]|nr:SDR family oxidoreductase [Pseudomonadota bacterium]